MALHLNLTIKLFEQFCILSQNYFSIFWNCDSRIAYAICGCKMRNVGLTTSINNPGSLEATFPNLKYSGNHIFAQCLSSGSQLM